MISLHQLMLGDGRLRPPSEDWDLPISCEVGEVIEVRRARAHTHARTHARAPARTHARTRARARAGTRFASCESARRWGCGEPDCKSCICCININVHLL